MHFGFPAGLLAVCFQLGLQCGVRVALDEPTTLSWPPQVECTPQAAADTGEH